MLTLKEIFFKSFSFCPGPKNAVVMREQFWLFVLRYYFNAVASRLSVLQIYTHTYATNTMTHDHFSIKK